MTDETPGGAGMTEADFAYLERLAAAAAESGLYGRSANVKAQLLMKLHRRPPPADPRQRRAERDRHLRRQDGAVLEPHRGAARGPTRTTPTRSSRRPTSAASSSQGRQRTAPPTTRARVRWTSRSRPKNSLESRVSNARRPLYGHVSKPRSPSRMPSGGASRRCRRARSRSPTSDPRSGLKYCSYCSTTSMLARRWPDSYSEMLP